MDSCYDTGVTLMQWRGAGLAGQETDSNSESSPAIAFDELGLENWKLYP